MEASIQEQADAGIEVVNARLNYFAEGMPKPVNYAYDPPAGIPRRSGKYIEQRVAVRNGREELSKLSLDINGFFLTEHETAFDDPNGPPNATPRESIEARVLVFWAPESA
jgi:hypothetical protein